MTDNVMIQCDAKMTIAVVEDYFGKFEQALGEGTSITLQAEAVQQVDTAFLQMICCLQTSLKDQDLSLIWQSPSEALINAADNLGLQQVLGLDQLQ